jgi:hypothetical protein
MRENIKSSESLISRFAREYHHPNKFVDKNEKNKQRKMEVNKV